MIPITNYLQEMFSYDFMRHAYYAGSITAVLCALIGYFVVIRGLAFASHSLGHIGFAGAAGAGLVGLSPPIGQMIVSVIAALGMGTLGERIEKSDTVIGILLAFFLGLGILFIYFYKTYAVSVMNILFGDILGVSSQLIFIMSIATVISLLVLSIIARPLLFASLEPELAEARGISLKLISILFLCLTAVAVTVASQIVGILLVFTLLVGPAASAINLVKTFWRGLGLSVLISLLIVWLGIFLTYATDWPSAFWFSALSLFFYLLSINYWNKVR